MARVVAETESVMSLSLSSKRRDSVVLPAPDGEDSTSISPRRLISLDILRLLAELVDHGLERQPRAGKRDVGGFRAQRVGFAVELLRQEIELAADRVAGREKRARLLHMRAQPVEL